MPYGKRKRYHRRRRRLRKRVRSSLSGELGNRKRVFVLKNAQFASNVGEQVLVCVGAVGYQNSLTSATDNVPDQITMENLFIATAGSTSETAKMAVMKNRCMFEFCNSTMAQLHVQFYYLKCRRVNTRNINTALATDFTDVSTPTSPVNVEPLATTPSVTPFDCPSIPPYFKIKTGRVLTVQPGALFYAKLRGPTGIWINEITENNSSNLYDPKWSRALIMRAWGQPVSATATAAAITSIAEVQIDMIATYKATMAELINQGRIYAGTDRVKITTDAASSKVVLPQNPGTSTVIVGGPPVQKI